METFEDKPPIDPAADVMGTPKTRFKQKLGQLGRRLKRIDVRGEIVMHPFAAVGIGAAAGALTGLMMQPRSSGRLTRAVVATLGAIGFRLVREAALIQLGGFTKDWLSRSEVATGTDADTRTHEWNR